MLLVFGSLNVDLLFQVETLPRPGETVLCPGYEVAAGGKGANQAAAASRAGAEVCMVGQVGDDEFGRFARAAVADAGVDVTPIGTSDRPTGIAVIGVDRAGENQITVASGANLDVRSDLVPDDLLAQATTLLCQAEVPLGETFALIRRGRDRNVRSVLNLAPAGVVPAEDLDQVEVLVVNESEAATVSGMSRGGDPIELARDLAKKHDLVCIVTLGASGAIAMTPDGGYRVERLKVEAVDTTGAGDTFVGVLAAALDQGLALDKALARASVAAGLCCKTLGAQGSQPTAGAIEAGLADLAEAAPFA